jgi:predicted amidophosphoribosyltransferase
VTHPAGPPLGFPNCARCPYLASGPVAICIRCAMSTVPPLSPNRCPLCAQALEAGSACRNSTCRQSEGTRGFGTVAAISMYSEPLKTILKSFKYDESAAGWAPIFGRLVFGWLEANASITSQYNVIIGNPTTNDRQPIRHIETILEAAQVEDLRRRWPIRTDLLFKRMTTPTSAGHGLYEKQLAAGQHAEAIDLMVDFAGAKVLLFDDIFTTGSQLSAVARKLRGAGALRIDGLVIARVPWGG